MSRIYNYCIHLLARQDYSEFKLRQKLRSKPQNLPHEIDEALEKLKAKGLLKEENYRRLFIRKWLLKGEAEDKIRQRGIMEKLDLSAEEFASAMTELGLKKEDNLEKLIAKKLRAKEIPTDPKEKQKLREKLLRYLLSKGHDYSAARQSLSAYL